MPQEANQLIKEVLKGNESAMELLVKAHYNLVHSFIYRSVGEYNTAYDLTQETFIKMMKHLKQYRSGEGAFKNWLLKIAANTCKDYFRSNTYRQRMQSEEIETCHLVSEDEVISLLDKNEERKKIKEAISALPILQREAIILKYYHSLKISEISKLTEEKENTIKSRLFNGIKNLRKALGKEDYDEELSAQIHSRRM